MHQHCGESGAIGCALEAHRLIVEEGARTSFIGLDRVQQIAFRTTRSEKTRCYFCKNKCLRTFIDVKTGAPARPTDAAAPLSRPRKQSQVPLLDGEQRLIVATCEKGTVEDVNDMREIKQGLDAIKKANPNLLHAAAHEAFASANVADVSDPLPQIRVWMAAGQKTRLQRPPGSHRAPATPPYRHAACAEHVQPRAVLHRVLPGAGHPR